MDARDLHARVVEKAMTDPGFRESLRANPRLTLEATLSRSIPADVEIVVLEDTPTRMHLVLPAAQASERELSEQELDSVAGGFLSLGRFC